ncbi:hypothetical protein [uncultured Draconibacterium sp.]|uniref:hypothetical protein n=1 Tax=uncultured Draconibacterium sp. TaxID=1573823 RepID=UPI00326099EC
MKQYFVEITAAYVPKNKAHEQIQEFVRTFNCNLVDEKEKAKTIEAINSKLEEVNKTFTRCNDIRLSGWIHENETIAIDGNFILTFKEVKNRKV